MCVCARLLVVLFDHVLADLLRSLSHDLLDVVGLGRVRVDASVLQVIVAEENHEVTRVRRFDFLRVRVRQINKYVNKNQVTIKKLPRRLAS